MKTTVLLLVALAILCGVDASHFRGSFISWEIVSGRTVKFTVSHAWRAGASSSVGLYLGDGSSTTVGPYTNVFSGTDQAGEGYNVFKETVTKTYTSDGPFTVYFYDCCRISTLQNSADSYFKVTTVVDLRSKKDSPIASIPPLLQLPISSSASYQIGVADANGLGYTCSLTPNADSSISATASIGSSVISVTSGCNIVWDTSAGASGRKYAVSITIKQAGTSTSIPLDFIIELVAAASKPSCTVSGAGANQITVGQTWTATITGTSTRAGVSSLKVTALGLASHATLNPAAGSSGSIPFAVTLTAKPTAPGAYSTSIVFTDPYNTQTTCSVAYQVVAPQVDCSVVKFSACDVKSYSLSASDASADSYSWGSNCTGTFDSAAKDTVKFTSAESPNVACKFSVDINKASVVTTCTKIVTCPICGSAPCRQDQPAVYAVSDAASIDKYVLGDVLATPTDNDGAIVAATANSPLPPGVSLSASGVFYVSNTALLDDGSYPISVTTWDAAGGSTTQTITIVLLEILCGTGLQSCGYACYDPNVHTCLQFNGHRHLCLKGHLICSYQDQCCYDPAVQDCYNGTLCPKNYQRCKGQCFDTQARDCIKNTVGEYLCLKGFQVCGSDCYDPVAQSCQNGQLCLKTEQLCGNVCFNPVSSDCLNNVLVPKGNKLCGPANYDPTVYNCYNGHTLCPTNTGLCGSACFDAATYTCKADFTLCPYKYERCGGACYDDTTRVCCDPATDRIVLLGQSC